jgi:hypothetical protein
MSDLSPNNGRAAGPPKSPLSAISGHHSALASNSTSALDNGAYAEGGATKLSEAKLCHNAKSIRYVREGGLFGITNLNSSDP